MLEWDLIEESENIIQVRLESSEGFEQAIFISPQQLSHCAGGEQAFPGGLHVGGDQIGYYTIVLKSLHHRLPGERREEILLKTNCCVCVKH